jgi:hypothetical protein
LLVTVASTVAAQHGVERARSICSELACNDELWAFIAQRVDRQPAAVDGTAAETRALIDVVADSVPPELATLEGAAPSPPPDKNCATANTVALPPAAHTSAEPATVLREAPARAQPSKSKRRRRQKGNGVAR